MAPRRGSLRRKLVAIVLSTTLVALLLALAAMVAYDLRVFYRSWADDIGAQAELVGRVSAPALAFDDPAAAQANLDLLRLRPQIQAAAIYTGDGALFAGYRRDADTAALPREPRADGVSVGTRNLALFHPVHEHGERLGTVYLRSDFDLRARLADYAGIAAMVAVLAMLVAWQLTLRLLRVVTDPLLAIADIAGGVVEHGDYTRRAPAPGNDEVGALADAFNRMLAEIEARTRALQQANAELGREVVERTRAQQQVVGLNSELEDRVRQRTAELEAAVEELEAFSYSVSHDLRAPLRSIDGFSQALLDDFGRGLPDEAQRYLARIRASTLRMGQLIEDLLNLSRVGRVPLALAPVDVSELAARVGEQLALAEPGRRVELQVQPGMSARADPRLLHTVFENLLGNAWKFTARRDDARIEVGVEPTVQGAAFYVRDNGAGFDMAYADKLFGAFQRLHSGADFAGTGIGLATVQRIIHRHGGRIWAEADVGRGATFRFTLAARGAEQPTGEA
jgi:signal transduction histidine kinase